MYNIDIRKFIGKIAEKGYSKKSFAHAAGVSVPTFFRYLRKPESIPCWFIAKSAELLCDSQEEARAIFLKN